MVWNVFDILSTGGNKKPISAAIVKSDIGGWVFPGMLCCSLHPVLQQVMCRLRAGGVCLHSFVYLNSDSLTPLLSDGCQSHLISPVSNLKLYAPVVLEKTDKFFPSSSTRNTNPARTISDACCHMAVKVQCLKVPKRTTPVYFWLLTISRDCTYLLQMLFKCDHVFTLVDVRPHF